MSDSNVKKRQHYVPQFYLKGFSPVEAPEYIYSYSISRRHVYGPQHVREVAHERYFYNLGLNQAIEDALSKLEDRVAPVHAELVRAGSVEGLSAVQSNRYAEFLAFMLTSRC